MDNFGCTLYTLRFSLLTWTFGQLFSSSEAQVDEELVFEAVRQNRVALRFAADELRSDGETHQPNIHSSYELTQKWEVICTFDYILYIPLLSLQKKGRIGRIGVF